MQLHFHPDFSSYAADLKRFIEQFDNSGQLFGDGKRNKIKLFDLDGKTVNIKSFKIPNLINQVAYKFFRKSKARRSFEFANILRSHGIGTPQPIAYAEDFSTTGLRKSFYLSEHLSCDLTYRELVEIPDYPDHDNILRQFVHFCFKLHESGIEFLDHSPGNTLIRKESDGRYSFFLVDLNRMQFHPAMTFDQRMKNLSRLTPKKEMVAVMANEYAKLYPVQTEQAIFEKMWAFTDAFQIKFHKKIKLKKALKFWK
ncbi:lipopolysaccharide kinase InaA family protein [Flavobacterium caeni]|uniref:Lipopolysaccharide kinase (Kdo/WaaP) family protein n=1 Tax=Flavobacterium caeni TaxID=490189 RepID=A0A1G5AWP9_9FLAO|nr:lipopolysaccharide kinase InaA family protein [Flavobacterium caeni]SCX82293.1 Lipopolysaccharide kinase (Kdo/WaaP) family protein [Flavobacterium caeni]